MFHVEHRFPSPEAQIRCYMSTLPKKVRDVKAQVEAMEKEGRDGIANPPKDPAATAVTDVNPTPVVTDATAPTQQQENDPQYWKKRFVGQKKAYDEVIPGLRDENRRQTQEIITLNQRNNGLQTALNEAVAKQIPAKPNTPREITVDDIMATLPEEDRKAYDADFFNVMSRIINGVNKINGNAGSSVRPDDLVNRVNNIEARVQKSDAEEFFDTLDLGIPGWEAMQASPEMDKWLLTHNDLLGSTPNEVVKAAQAALNAKRIIAIFKMYTDTKKPATNVAIPHPLEHLQMPDSSGGGEIVTQNDEVFMVSSVQKFYSDLAKGKYRGKDAEAKSFENRIIAAQKSGRIRQG